MNTKLTTFDIIMNGLSLICFAVMFLMVTVHLMKFHPRFDCFIKKFTTNEIIVR